VLISDFKFTRPRHTHWRYVWQCDSYCADDVTTTGAFGCNEVCGSACASNLSFVEVCAWEAISSLNMTCAGAFVPYLTTSSDRQSAEGLDDKAHIAGIMLDNK
jgi:hypothetical protein